MRETNYRILLSASHAEILSAKGINFLQGSWEDGLLALNLLKISQIVISTDRNDRQLSEHIRNLLDAINQQLLNDLSAYNLQCQLLQKLETLKGPTGRHFTAFQKKEDALQDLRASLVSIKLLVDSIKSQTDISAYLDNFIKLQETLQSVSDSIQS